MWWLFFILFLLVSIFSSVALFYALRRINQYENMLVEFAKIINFSTEKMKQVDTRGHYESDDETNFFFEQMKSIQNLLNGIFEREGVEETKEKVDVKTNN